MIEQSGPTVMSKRSLLYINRLEKFIRKNGQMSQLPNVLDTSDCLHYCAIVAIMKKCSLRRERERTVSFPSFVPSICIHRSTNLIFIQKKTTHFLTTIVKNLTFSLSPTLCVCVCVSLCVCVCMCVCVLRERERERERELNPFSDLPTPKYICQYSKLPVSVFSDL